MVADTGSRDEMMASKRVFQPASKDKDDVLVSAIVSVYKAERFLVGCLADLESQTIADRIEIIVVDSASPERERNIVEDYQNRFGNIRYVRTQQRETIYQAWNRAILLARGKYITNANADDRHRPDALEQLAHALEQRSDVGVVYADSFVSASENASWGDCEPTGVFHWPSYDRRRLFGICFIGPQPMWRRSLHKKHGLFDAALKSAGDYEFWLRLAAAGVMFMHVPQILGLHLASPNEMELSDKGLSHTEAELSRKRYWSWLWGACPPSAPTFLFPALPHDPLVSVIMPTCNRPGLLVDAIRSLVAQTYPNWEAIVVNDGGDPVSSQLTPLEHGGRVRYLEHWKRLGQAAARNTALRLARGQIVCYLDDDDRLDPAHLQGIVGALRTAGSPFAYTGATRVMERFDGSSRIILEKKDLSAKLQQPQDTLLVNNFLPINTWAHRRECLHHVGFFDESMVSHEDWEFLLRFAKRWTFARIDSPTAEVRVRPTTKDSVTTRNRERYVQDLRRVYALHPSRVRDIQSRRKRELADELEHSHSTNVRLLFRRIRALFDRHIGWRVQRP